MSSLELCAAQNLLSLLLLSESISLRYSVQHHRTDGFVSELKISYTTEGMLQLFERKMENQNEV